MTRLEELVLPNDGPSDQPAHGALKLTDSVTFIAGPNGSGKSRLLKWLATKLSATAQIPVGSKLTFSIGDISPESSEIIQERLGNGPFFGSISLGRYFHLHQSPERKEPTYLATPTDVVVVPEGLQNVTLSGSLKRQLERGPYDARTGPGVMLNDSVFLPVEQIRALRYKVISAVRLRNIGEAMRRPADAQQYVTNHRKNPNPIEAFALLEADTSLEIEVLARVEALTGVKCRLNKEGSEYRVDCSRVGRSGGWHMNDEADGVTNLLILLPYLYSTHFDLLFIDEPEAHLYPGLQQTFRSLAFDAAERTGKQIVLATHSEKIVAPPAPNFRKAIHVTIPHPERPEIIQLHDAISRLGEDAGKLHEWLSQQAFGDNQDSVFSALFASETVVVEGPFDLIFLDRIARLVGREFRAGSVAFIEAGGKGGVARMVRFLKSLGRLVKVVVDDDVFHQFGVLRGIAAAMGTALPENDPSTLNEDQKNELRARCQEFDVHILAKAGIEHYYRTLKNKNFPGDSSEKRTALIRELKDIEELTIAEVRARYLELIKILEAAVRRMPSEWLEAHAQETLRVLGQLMRSWRKAIDAGQQFTTDHSADWFAAAPREVDGCLVLQHRFLPEPAIKIKPTDDVVSVVDEWIKNFAVPLR